MKGKLVKENIVSSYNLEDAETEIIKMYHYFADEKMADYEGMGEWLAELMVNLYQSPTYGDYLEVDAQSDLDSFMEGWDSVIKKI